MAGHKTRNRRTKATAKRGRGHMIGRGSKRTEQKKEEKTAEMLSETNLI